MAGIWYISDAIIIVVTLVVLVWTAIIIYICCVCCNSYKEKRASHGAVTDRFGSGLRSIIPFQMLPLIMGNRGHRVGSVVRQFTRPSNQSVLSLYSEPELPYVSEQQSAFIIQMFGTKQYIDSPPDYESANYNTLPTYEEAIDRLKLDLSVQINCCDCEQKY